MEILLCQACGSILRGKSKYCTGCGAFVSRYSPTTISSSGRSSSPLTINFAPDPLVMEKAISRRQLDQYRTSMEGNGSNGGNGNHSDPSSTLAAYDTSPQSPEPAEPEVESVGPTSLLGSVLKGVANQRAPFGSDATSLISFDEEPAAPAIPEPLPPLSPTPSPPVQTEYDVAAQSQPTYQPASPPSSFGGFPTEVARPAETAPNLQAAATFGGYPAQPPAASYGTEQAAQPATAFDPASTLAGSQPASVQASAEPPIAASATGPLVPPAALTQGGNSNFASPAAATSGPVFSARVPIPFLPRPSNFLRSQPNSSELDSIPTPTADPASAFAPVAAAAPPAPSQQTASQPFDSLTDDPFFSQPASIPPAGAPNDPLFNPATAPYPVTGQNDPLFSPAQNLPGSGFIPNDPLFAPAAQAPAANPVQTDPLFTPAPSTAVSAAAIAQTQPAPQASPDLFAPAGNSASNSSMPGALPPDPRQTGIFGKQSVNPTAFSFGEPTITSPSAEAILPPLYPVSGPEPPPPASTPAQTVQTVQAPAAQPDGFFAATGTPASQPTATTSGFDFFNAPAAAAPAPAPAPAPAQQPSLQAQAQVQPATTLSPMDLFQGEVISHPPGSSGPQPNQFPSQNQPVSMEFDPAPARQAAQSASPASGFYDSAPAPVAPSGHTADFNPAAGLSAPPASPNLPVSAEPSAGGAPTSGADFFSGGGQAASGSTGSAKADGPKYSGLDREEATDKNEDDEQKASSKDKSSTGLRDKAARESDAPAAKGSFFEQVMEFLKDLDGECSVLGKMLPKKQVLICGAVLAVIGIQVSFAMFGMVSKGITGALGGMQQQSANNAASQVPPLSGTWEIAYQSLTEQKVHPGTVALNQKGSNLYGEGRDEAMFVMQGTYNPPKVMLSKQYIVDGQPKGKPITWIGKVTYSKQEPPFMDGTFVAYIKKGVFTSAHLEEVRGNWQAQMVPITQPGEVRNNFSRNQPPPAASSEQQPGNEQQQDTSAAVGVNLPDLFMKIAVGLLFLGVLLVIGSLKLFGPSGLINIWSKKEYIPSQFKSQHKKMLKELGKPLKPGGLPLGEREDWHALKVGEPKELHLTPEMRDSNPHMLIMGAGAKGKSRLIANMITHDIQSGDRATVLIDSDGHLVDLILRWLASHPKGKEFSRRVLVIDPTNKSGCAAFNPLEPPEDGDYQAAASSVVYGFKAIYTEPPGSQTQWNQQTANILRNSALLLMANGKTLTDLPRLLGDNDFRDELLEKIERRKNERVEFITLLDQWAQYKRLARTDQWINWVEPILNRVTPMLGDPRIRPILTSAKGDLSLRQIIQDQQVLLVKVPQGQLDQNAALLGSLLVTGIKQAALSLSTTSTKKHFTALYLDEFDNFIEKETFDAITSETRKFQIGFTAAIKSVQHLPEDFRNQLTINVGTICAFSLAKKDADVLGPSMFRVDGRKVKHQTIQNIFNKVNTSPQFELISDEEKLNIDRLVGQEERTYFCYRVGTVAGVFHMKAHEFKDVPDKDVNWSLVDQIYGNKKSEV